MFNLTVPHNLPHSGIFSPGGAIFASDGDQTLKENKPEYLGPERKDPR